MYQKNYHDTLLDCQFERQKIRDLEMFNQCPEIDLCNWLMNEWWIDYLKMSVQFLEQRLYNFEMEQQFECGDMLFMEGQL